MTGIMLLIFSVSAAVLMADQASKRLIVSRLSEGEATRPVHFGFRLRHVSNRRRGWGSTAAVRLRIVAWLGIVVAGLIAGAIVGGTAASIGGGATIGGAAGNLRDGVRRGCVTDFVDLRVWPVFNLADAALVTGGLLTTWGVVAVLRP